jgi:hypothetical protein
MSLDQTECGDGAVVEPQRDVRVIVSKGELCATLSAVLPFSSSNGRAATLLKPW